MKQQAFSLLELSIVLVIIGLIAGGIVAGSSMIRAAELRSVMTELNQYQTAVNTFRDKYLGLPGDLKNASAFWGYPGGSSANCPATAGTGTETCNGDGDGIIDTVAASEYGETFMFWQHLANADLISGTYTGMSAGAGVRADESNAPQSKLNGALWSSFYRMNAANGSGATQQAVIFDVQYGNTLQIGAAGGGSPLNPIFTPSEIWTIDKKIDDGKPGQGKLHAARWDDCTDATAFTDYLNAEYLLSDDSQLCALLADAPY